MLKDDEPVFDSNTAEEILTFFRAAKMNQLVETNFIADFESVD